MAESADKIQITIKVDGKTDTKMSVKRSSKFGKIFDAYNKSKGFSSDAYVFHFEGELVNREQTPESLGVEDGAELDGIVAQTGGSC